MHAYVDLRYVRWGFSHTAGRGVCNCSFAIIRARLLLLYISRAGSPFFSLFLSVRGVLNNVSGRD